MEFDEDQQAEAIAAEWGVDVALLEQARWTLETIDGADGELYGYMVRFDDDETPPEILAQLGLRAGQLERQLSVNAFDELEEGSYGSGAYGNGPYGGDDSTAQDDEADDGIYSINEPLPDLSEVMDDSDEFPDLPPGQAYLTDENDRILTGEQGRGLIVDIPNPAGSIGGAPLNEYAINGPTYAGASFAGSSFAIGPESPNQAESIAALRSEMLNRLDELETVLRQSVGIAPNRGHNHPPELLEVERPISQRQREEVAESITAIRRESLKTGPNIETVMAEASTLRKVATTLGLGAAVVGGFVMQEVASLEIGIAHAKHRDAVIAALTKAYDSVMAWAHAISTML